MLQNCSTFNGSEDRRATDEGAECLEAGATIAQCFLERWRAFVPRLLAAQQVAGAAVDAPRLQQKRKLREAGDLLPEEPPPTKAARGAAADAAGAAPDGAAAEAAVLPALPALPQAARAVARRKVPPAARSIFGEDRTVAGAMTFDEKTELRLGLCTLPEEWQVKAVLDYLPPDVLQARARPAPARHRLPRRCRRPPPLLQSRGPPAPDQPAPAPFSAPRAFLRARF
jgi:hypothetical protein